MTPFKRRVVTLMGPTASGKTKLALDLAGRFDIALISVDSAMVYRGMDIGTAKPSRATRRKYPHALIDIREPEESFSVQAFCELADEAVQDAFDLGKIPVLVGGSMMYFRAFREGLADLPRANADIRLEIQELASTEGVKAVYEELADIDPESARKIDPCNLRRLERAIEVFRLTGKPIGVIWQERRTPPAHERLDCELMEFIMPTVPREELHAKIKMRLHDMLEDGLVDEVRNLRRRPHLTRESLAMRTVGYREIWAHLDNCDDRTDVNEVFRKVLVATRQLARKQITWLRQRSASEFRQARSVEFMIECLAG